MQLGFQILKPKSKICLQIPYSKSKFLSLNAKPKLKNQIQKWESFSTTQKQKSNFQAVLHFFICEAIIAQPSCFVNRYRKFFHAHLHNHLHCHLQIQNQPHLHWHNHIHIHIHSHTVRRFCVYLLMGWWVNVAFLVVCLYIYTFINALPIHSHIHRILHIGRFMGWAIGTANHLTNYLITHTIALNPYSHSPLNLSI